MGPASRAGRSDRSGSAISVGFSVKTGGLMAFELTGNRRQIAGDFVADNTTFHDPRANKTLIVGMNFGIVTDIQTALNGNLLVVSLDSEPCTRFSEQSEF
jgi:hypothetical protein